MKALGLETVNGRPVFHLSVTFPAETAKEKSWAVFVDQALGIIDRFVINPLPGQEGYEQVVDTASINLQFELGHFAFSPPSSATVVALQSLARPADPNDTVVSSATALAQVSPLSAAVPAGRLLHETERMSSPSVAPSEHRFLIDYTGRRMRFEGYVGGSLRFLEVNEGGSTASLSTFDSSLRAHPRSFDEYETSHDFLAALPVTRVSGLSVDGQPADVYRVEFPNRGGEIAAEYALIWVDTATGLRFWEKWMAGQEVVRVVTRRVVTPTPELGALLGRASVQASSVGGLESDPG